MPVFIIVANNSNNNEGERKKELTRERMRIPYYQIRGIIIDSADTYLDNWKGR